jgi:hypothetical protein
MKLFIGNLFAVVLFVLSISNACAWSGPGHMTVAAIAYRDLFPVERQKLGAILLSHPQFQSWRHAAWLSASISSRATDTRGPV